MERKIDYSEFFNFMPEEKWSNITIIKERIYIPRILYPRKISYKNNGHRQTVISMQELWEYCAKGSLPEKPNRALQKIKFPTNTA